MNEQEQEQEQRIRDYYANLSMPTDRIEMLLKAAEDSLHTRSQEVPAAQVLGSGWRSKLPSMLGSPWQQTAMACALIMLVTIWVHNLGSQTQLAQRTLREVAMNHTTRLEPEFRGVSLAMLDNSMHQLPFNLVLPKSIDSAYELIGSRYCSLGGVLAAHVKLQDKQSGNTVSLFVTSNSAELTQIQSQQQKLEGVDVEIWREGGLFFASAQRS